MDRESFELYNGWLVLDEGTDLIGAGVAANILEIVTTAARIRNFGWVLPDQVECELKNGDVIKPDACLVSDERSNTRVIPRGPDKKKVLQGGPELAVEFRLPTKSREEELHKRKLYFDNDTSIVWEVDPKLETISVWRAETPDQYTEFKGGDLIDCEPFLPGWRRRTEDFFDKSLTAEQLFSEIIEQWRFDERSKILRDILVQTARGKFASDVASDLEEQFAGYNIEQLTDLVASIATSATFAEWLATFPAQDA